MGAENFTYDKRIERLQETKLNQTLEKQKEIGSMDHDDWALILPPKERRKKIETISTSGMPITDILLDGYQPESNHPSGGFFGPKACGRNFRNLLETHPPYINPMSSLAGGYMVNFNSYRDISWNPDFDYSHLHEDQQKYQLQSGIGASQHFCQDMSIGLELGWGGILEKINKYSQENTDKSDFYDGERDVVLGIQNWIGRTADEALKLAEKEENQQVKNNLIEIAEMNEHLVTDPPETFREACQWIAWYLITARMYNGSGSLGRLDVMLEPYYKRDLEKGVLTDEEAIFHVACLLLADTAYLQVGGPNESGNDLTNPVSFFILEAAHKLNIPSNIGVSVGKDINPDLLKRGVEILFEDKSGHPKFLGSDNTVEGFAKNKDMTVELGRQRAYAGCHWSGIPGREYTLLDCVKLSFGAVFENAWQDMMSDQDANPSTTELWDKFVKHLKNAVNTIAKGLDFHLEHMHQVLPELVLDLCCHGPIEKGQDASHGGVEFYNMCVDGAGLATVADSFAALEKRIEAESRISWEELNSHLENNWNGSEGEQARLIMNNTPQYGSGDSTADKYAVKISEFFSEIVTEKPTPNGFTMVPGLFSWANTLPMGKKIGATPNGRKAGEPISHGANPHAGFREDGAASAMAVAIASVQSGYGNTAPMQIEFDPDITNEKEAVENIMSLIQTHFMLGGTMINMNVMDEDKVLAAHKNPEKFPDLVVRVTGFSAYFSSLSEEFRQLVVDRILSKRVS